MESNLIVDSTLFLEDCLNKKSKVVTHPDFKEFLTKLHQIAKASKKKIVIQIKPHGERCSNCNKYMKRASLSNSIHLFDMEFVCSVWCLREMKRLGQSKSRKNTDGSSSTIEDDSVRTCEVSASRCSIF
ncbi:hypothetical protein SteCoe_32448 [Stentor coeruleus]|uniref:Uncharacterized protein n=1 Tax=Stentor coeruleus TaxID=5963 RepID=A0A1R2AYY5_9CILI|nr:hypothetical protein SteCoe_32448 [Stentor coeruleus]